MTKIEELNKELDELQTKIKEVQEAIEKARQAEWPQKGDTYWFTYSYGEISQGAWTDATIDHERMSIGNVFRTEEEAEFEIEHLKVIAELKKFAMSREEINAARYNKMVYGIVLDSNNEIEIFNYIDVRRVPLYFESAKIAREAVRAVGEDRIKKYYFGVED